MAEKYFWEEMNWKKFFVSVIGGFIAAFVWYFFFGMIFGTTAGPGFGYIFIVLLMPVVYFLYKRTSRVRYTAGWACVLISLGCFAFPVGLFIFSIFSASKLASEGGAAAAVGAGIGGAIVTGFGLILGLVFGIPFSIAAYFLLKK